MYRYQGFTKTTTMFRQPLAQNKRISNIEYPVLETVRYNIPFHHLKKIEGCDCFILKSRESVKFLLLPRSDSRLPIKKIRLRTPNFRIPLLAKKNLSDSEALVFRKEKFGAFQVLFLLLTWPPNRLSKPTTTMFKSFLGDPEAKSHPDNDTPA